MSTLEHDNPLDPAYQVWCLSHFGTMAEGGVWMVPRSGLIFRRSAGRLELIQSMPWLPEMEGRITPDELEAQQAGELDVITRHFAAVDIEVVDARG